MTLAAIAWTAPAWLAGLAAVALPILAHLWSRSAGPPAWFPSLRLLQEAQTDLTRRSALCETALLICRCLIVAMVVLAFARPVWTQPVTAPPAAEPPAGRRVFILLDASASMTRHENGISLFHTARQQIRRLIGTLDPARDRVAVILAGAQPLLPEPTANFDALRQRLEAAKPGMNHADLSATIRSTPGNAELHVFSDIQAASLRGRIDRPVHWHRLGGSLDAANLALFRARLDPPQPIVGAPCRVMVEAANYGSDTARPTVELTGDAAGSASLEIPPGQNATATIVTQFDSPGPTLLKLALPPDHFELDNRIEVMVDVRQSIDVLMVTDQSVDDPRNEAYYLSRAIQPGPGGPYRLRVIAPDEIVNEKPPGLLVLCGRMRLTRDMQNTLAQWMTRSAGQTGTLSFPTDDRPSGAESLGYLPVADWRTPDQPVGLDPASLDARFFAPFEGEARQTLLDLRFGRVAYTPWGENIQPIARWLNGQPALLTGDPNGNLQARAVQWSGSIDPSDSDLVRSPAFVPLVHRMIEWVMPGGVEPTIVTAGETARVPLSGEPAIEKLAVRAPDGQTLAFRVQSLQKQKFLLCDSTGQLGLHRIDNEQGITRGGFTVTLDPRESDLHPLDELPSPATVAKPARDAGGAVAADKMNDRDTPLWPWCVALAVVVGMAEMALAAVAQHQAGQNIRQSQTSETKGDFLRPSA